MVTAKTQYNLKNAREYFEEHLCVGDYYNEGQRVAGEWTGLGAERLGLSGRVRADDFLRLCENQHPATGETLTQRLNTTRTEAGENAANRRIFYDFTFSPPKSVSLTGFIGKDERILEAHARVVKAAVKEFEAFAATRIRTSGAQSDRLTRNFTAALFAHDTSRALDPHLHTHCIVFNATFDPVENRWKAIQNYELLHARKFAENAYYHELARELRNFGYRIRNRARGDFQIDGVSDELCERFSKRHAEIDQTLAKLLEEKPGIAAGDLMAARRLIATAERARKQRDLSQAELLQLWESQMTRDERQAISRLRNQSTQSPSDEKRMSLAEAVHWAEEHLFDRNSVVLECQVWQEALGRARGGGFSVGELTEFTRQRGYIRDRERPGEVTLRDVLLREWDLVQTAKDGVAACHPLVANPRPVKATLEDEQRKALDALLASTNAVSVFRGGAGTGKSYVLRELVEQLRESGRCVVVLAPQRQQVVDMEKAGLPSPSTVANFLLKGELATGAVVVVDEAGQIGGRQMLELLRFAREQNARVILSGDTRQHGAVEASDALLAIERHSGVKPVELHRIRRQDPALGRDDEERDRIRAYRKAVESAAAGKVGESFGRLDKMGAIVACGLADQADRLADEYLRLTEGHASAVVVSQTWAEVHRVNSRVRDALKAKGLLGSTDATIQVLDRLDLTNAQKRDERFYPKDAVVVFNQKIRRGEPGAKGKLAGIVKAGVLVEVGGRFVTVSNKMLDRISVCLPRELAVAPGDRLHLKANRKLASGGRVTNGELVTVKSVCADGGIELTDGRMLDREFREFLPGYAVTSYGSQGKTVDYVLFSDSTIKAATNAQQWYVTISRGRRGIRIFTPDKEQLRENVTRSGHRRLALDLAPGIGPLRGVRLWDRLHRYLLRFGRRAADNFCRLKLSRRRNHQPVQTHEHKITRMLGERSERSRDQNRSIG
ncbi:MAG TPA: MobF family relaxase [Verrucomicrobiota bacterium]|nr:MobF family relaxase [Verrucomicrobiota bacterium]HOQ54902.1 MobF family relaxase [Verrucomicrobiota bacterium]HPL35332.1 MobF family relaxase [Verrucomicrobiota bacterium]